MVGTGNRSELTVGYFTKHGDGGVDLLPIANLVKNKLLNLPGFWKFPPLLLISHLRLVYGKDKVTKKKWVSPTKSWTDIF